MTSGTPRMRVAQQDIAKIAVDAVVNAANDRLWMGAGVAGALKKAGGREIETEAKAKGPIPIGDAVATGAGRLPARWVIHAAVMGLTSGTSREAIDRATRSALRVAEELGARTVAMPAFGTGVGRFPVEECARLMVSAVREHRGSVEEVIFALRGDDAVRAFEAAIA